jgi:hypothetical protein
LFAHRASSIVPACRRRAAHGRRARRLSWDPRIDAATSQVNLKRSHWLLTAPHDVATYCGKLPSSLTVSLMARPDQGHPGFECPSSATRVFCAAASIERNSTGLEAEVISAPP